MGPPVWRKFGQALWRERARSAAVVGWQAQLCDRVAAGQEHDRVSGTYPPRCHGSQTGAERWSASFSVEDLTLFTASRAGGSGASLQLADRQVSGEHRLTGVTRQPRVGFGGHLGAIAGLLQLHHRVATG